MKAYAGRAWTRGRPTGVAALALVAAAATSLATVASLATVDRAFAQSSDVPEITITKPPGGYGAYGRNLPGVYMTTNSGISTGPEPGSPTPAYSWVDPMPELTYQNNPVGWVDGWHGAVGNGIPF